MALNKSKGNMYEFVTHTWNTVKGDCLHGCSYCYMKGIARRFNRPQCPIHFDEAELKTNLGHGNFIFVGSSNDLFAEDIPHEWIDRTLYHCCKYNNKYLFQTKNPLRVRNYLYRVLRQDIVVTTLETNRFMKHIMKNAPSPEQRTFAMEMLARNFITAHVTIEPIMDFDLHEFIKYIMRCRPVQVNIGADTGHNHLPEPPKEKILELISALEELTTVKQKSNLKRILK
jgi:DNA repair photolyase